MEPLASRPLVATGAAFHNIPDLQAKVGLPLAFADQRAALAQTHFPGGPSLADEWRVLCGVDRPVQCQRIELQYYEWLSGTWASTLVYDPLPAERTRLGLPTAEDMRAIFAVDNDPNVLSSYDASAERQPRLYRFLKLLRRGHPGATVRFVEHGFGRRFDNLIAATHIGFPEVVATEKNEQHLSFIEDFRSPQPEQSLLGGVAVYDAGEHVIDGDVVIFIPWVPPITGMLPVWFAVEGI